MNYNTDFVARLHGNNVQAIAVPPMDLDEIKSIEFHDKVVKLFYAYLLLLIFEGALRKWFLPFLANPLLIVRDPLGVYIIFLFWKHRQFPKSILLTSGVIMGIATFFLALFVGHKNLFVAIFGARCLLIHFPLVFLFGKILNHSDVVKIGKLILLISIPITILTVLQFYSPQSALVNRGVGGSMEGAGFNGGALGYFRPPGTFSFTNGSTAFFSLVACFMFYFWLNSHLMNKTILLASSLCVFIELPISISRGLLFQVLVSFVFALFIIARNPKFLGKIFIAFIAGFILISILQNFPFFTKAIEAFTVRFTNASSTEGGLQGTMIDRFLFGMFGSLVGFERIPLWGYGVGLGTNVGAQMTTGSTSFLIAEDEWPRSIGELGPLLGILLILIRAALTFNVAFASFRQLKVKNFLPWMLLSYGGLVMFQGTWAQPTSLGFYVVMASLSISALYKSKEESEGHNPPSRTSLN